MFYPTLFRRWHTEVDQDPRRHGADSARAGGAVVDNLLLVLKIMRNGRAVFPTNNQ